MSDQPITCTRGGGDATSEVQREVVDDINLMYAGHNPISAPPPPDIDEMMEARRRSYVCVRCRER